MFVSYDGFNLSDKTNSHVCSFGSGDNFLFGEIGLFPKLSEKKDGR